MEQIMKKVFRIIIPLVLVAAILFCTGWYLLVYDRTFTQDILLNIARNLEDSGNLTASAWFYSSAYKQAGDNDTVAIELSNQYKNTGNYIGWIMNPYIESGKSNDPCQDYRRQP